MSREARILGSMVLIAIISLSYALITASNNPPIHNGIDKEKVACEQTHKELEGYVEGVIECETIPQAYTNKGKCCVPNKY